MFTGNPQTLKNVSLFTVIKLVFGGRGMGCWFISSYPVSLNLVKELRLVEDVQKPFRTLGHGSNAQGTILCLVKTEHEYSGQTQSEFAARLK